MSFKQAHSQVKPAVQSIKVLKVKILVSKQQAPYRD